MIVLLTLCALSESVLSRSKKIVVGFAGGLILVVWGGYQIAEIIASSIFSM